MDSPRTATVKEHLRWVAPLAGALLFSPTLEAAPPFRPDGAAIVRGVARAKDGTRDWKEARKGDVLTTGMSVEASASGPLEMLLPDGVTVTLEPGTLARWLTPGKLPSETNHYTHGYHLVLIEGELDVHMPQAPKGSHAFLVSTKAGTLTDWRGKLHVFSHNETTAAAIYEGALVVGSNGQGFPVYDGAGIVMKKGIDPDKSRVIPGSPKWDPAGGGMSSFVAAPGRTRATIGFAWEPVPGATSYRVWIATDPSMSEVIQRATTAETSFGLLVSGNAAPCWAQVRAVGPEGIVGEWSAPRPLRVVHFLMPEGAFVARDDTVVLPPGSTLSLDDADGVEVAYENVRGSAARIRGVPLYWAKLTGPLRIPDDTTMRIVHLRVASLGSGGTEFALARRQLRADVDLTPKSAHTGDTVDAHVMVWDPSGRIDPMGENVTIETMLDLTPLAAQWQRTGNVWTAHVHTRNTGGPSVARVVVKDGLGLEIGRGFLELAEPILVQPR